MVMQSVSSGYTIIEVLIFLAVSGMIFLSAVTLIGGHTSQTQFSETLRDTHSKLQDWINDVSTGVPTGNVGQYYCQLTVPFIKINNGPPPPGLDNPDCIFLGKAIQFTDQTYSTPSQASAMYAYPVFGQRLFNGDLVTNMQDANPTPAIGFPGCGAGTNSGTACDLWDEFDMPGNIQVTKLESAPGVSSNDHLIGFYNSFNTEQSTSTNGSNDLKTFSYPLGNEVPRSMNVYNCINNKNPCALQSGQTNPNPLSKLIICLSNGKDSGYITLNSLNGVGVSTQMDFGACP
jgi:hypothetical protein